MNLETMRLLVEKGLSATDLLEVAETMAIKTDRTAAERQARRRAKLKAEREASESADRDDVTRDVTRDDPLPLPLSPQTPQTPTPAPEQTPARVRADKFPCPVWCEKTVWNDLKANRRTKRLTNTETAHRQFVAAIESMADDDWPPGKLVEAIAAKGWGGPHDPRENRKPGNDNRNQRNSNRNAADLVRERLAMRSG